jgi:head-tail adaptor
MAIPIPSMAWLFIHTLSHFRPTRTSDGQGGWSVAYADLGTIVGRLRPASASERTVADQEQARVSHVLYCAATEDIERGDLFSLSGLFVEVIAVREPSNMGHHLEVDAFELQKAPSEVTS